MKQAEAFQQWVEGIPYEVAFWNNRYRWDSTFEGVVNWSRRGKPLELEGWDAQQFLSTFEAPIVLDVGCGLTYAKGDQLITPEGLRQLDVRYIDPLASYYNEIIQRHHREMPPVQFGMMEYLTAAVAPGSAALVIIHNALDHSADPMKGILSALCVLSVGGCLYLNHHPNEAEAEHYKGFHQFNICADEKRHCIIWNKNQRFVVDDIIAPFASISTQILENGFVVSIITKTGEVSKDLLDPCKDNQELSQLLMMQTRNSFNPGYALRLKMKYWWYNTIHFFVQSLSSENRLRLRRMIYRK